MRQIKKLDRTPLEAPGSYWGDLLWWNCPHKVLWSVQKHTLLNLSPQYLPPSPFLGQWSCFGISLGCLGGEREQTHPEIDAHGGDKAAGQKGGVLETDQQAGLPHARVPDQHHLCGGEGTWLSVSSPRGKELDALRLPHAGSVCVRPLLFRVALHFYSRCLCLRWSSAAASGSW